MELLIQSNYSKDHSKVVILDRWPSLYEYVLVTCFSLYSYYNFCRYCKLKKKKKCSEHTTVRTVGCQRNLKQFVVALKLTEKNFTYCLLHGAKCDMTNIS